MKIVKLTGLALFLFGFGVFIASFFLADYTLTKEKLENTIDDGAKAELLSVHISSILHKTYNSSFEFVAALDLAFTNLNNSLLDEYRISEQELNSIVGIIPLNIPFSLSKLSEVYNDDSDVHRFKLKAFHDYGKWLEGNTFSNAGELKKDLQIVSGNIKKYAIINSKGFDRYQVKDLKYRLTRESSSGPIKNNPGLFILLTYGLCILGSMLYILPKLKDGPPGIKNNGIYFNVMKNVGWLGILTGTFFILFYIFLYYYPEYMTNWVMTVDPISMLLKGSEAGRFFLYGFIYTLAILVMGIRMMINYRHSKYHIFRTISVMFFQTCFAFLIPEILLRLNKPYFDFKNIWPLDYDFFFDNELNTLIDGGTLGIFMLGWGLALIIIAVPVFVYFFGKRWYCSWVCGCGGLAETLGDPFRQLSNKSLKAWKVERWMIHLVLVFAVIMTAGVLYTYWTGSSEVFGVSSYAIRETYGAWIGAGFAGVIGTGFYPLMGNRVWCRFGCPLAAYLGFVQRFKSRFRITTNGGQCMSCGNCSTYCEMGIDVRWYAQRGQNIVRSSCVGCGICSSVCPRGVLKLENKSEKGRFGEPVLIGRKNLTI